MSLDDDLRDALGGPDGTNFDYDALVAGTKARASRIRRRRVAQQAVTVAVLAPVLVGTGWLVGTNLSGAPDQAQVASTTEATGADAAEVTTEAPATGEVPRTDEVPFQDVDLLPDSTPDAENPDLPNAWDVPDVRPTGVDFLDAMGAPVLDLRYPRILPLPTFMVGNDQGLVDGVEPLAGAEWSFADEGAGMFPDSVEITVTGWEDSAAVLSSLPTDTPVTHAQWLEPWTALAWEGADLGDLLIAAQVAGQEGAGSADAGDAGSGDADSGSADSGSAGAGNAGAGSADAGEGHLVGAVVRQGDYLVGVSVRARTQEEAVAAATEIADRTAANLAHLDPEHARE